MLRVVSTDCHFFLLILSAIMVNVTILMSVIMLSVNMLCYYAECHYAECHSGECIMVSVNMSNAIMLS